MSARFAVLAIATLSLAACETASTEDTGVHRGASPTLGEIGHHQRAVVRGPVVADATPVARSHAAGHPVAAYRAPARTTATHSAGTRTATVIPNPMRSGRTATTAPPASATTTTTNGLSTLPTEPVQPAAVTEEPFAPPATGDTQSPLGAYPTGDSTALPVDEPIRPTPPIDFGLGDLTPDKIEAMFGGMPFLLIAAIAAALVAALGLALRSPRRREEPTYHEPHVVDHDEDMRESYAA
ncbi:MAG: hypothetical protein GC190_13755 [Alphaproteobacteria bacterium]|nr:hypothetical protein [Alphaproteobacteria bacterium]